MSFITEKAPGKPYSVGIEEGIFAAGTEIQLVPPLFVVYNSNPPPYDIGSPIHQPSLSLKKCTHLTKEERHTEAENILISAISKNWHPTFLDLYGSITSKDPIAHLAKAEKWLTMHAEDPHLLLCLGRLCKKQTLWGKAKQYLQKSIQLQPRPETFNELGQVMEAENKIKEALEYYRQGLSLINNV